MKNILLLLSVLFLTSFAGTVFAKDNIKNLVANEVGAISIGSDGFFDPNSSIDFHFVNLETRAFYKAKKTSGYDSGITYHSKFMTDEEIDQLDDKTTKRIEKEIKKIARKYKPAKDKPAIAFVPPGKYSLIAIDGLSYYHSLPPHQPHYFKTTKVLPWFGSIEVKAGEILHLGSIRAESPIYSHYKEQTKKDYKRNEAFKRDVILPVIQMRDDTDDARAYFEAKYPDVADKVTYEIVSPKIDHEVFQSDWDAAEIDYSTISKQGLIKLYAEIIRRQR